MRGMTLLFLYGIMLSSLVNGLLNGTPSENIEGGMCSSSACDCDSYGRLTCNCGDQIDELILTSEGEKRLDSFTSRIIIKNCPSLIIMNSSLTHLDGLRLIKFEDIQNLTLFTESFQLSPKAMRININIQLSNIKILPSYTFRGDMEAITFKMVTIKVINSFAFTNLAGTNILRFEDCHFQIMEAQAFKKFDVNYFYIIRGTIGSQLPSRAMNDIQVSTKFCLDGIRMGIVKSSAFVIKKPKTVSIQNCVIENLEAEAFDISTRGPVMIKNNTFGSIAIGSFLGIERYLDEKLDTLPNYRINFINNTLNYFEEGSIMFNRDSFQLFLDNILINDTCQCDRLTTWKNNILNYTIYAKFHTSLSNQAFKTKSFDLIEERTYLCLDESLNVLSFDKFKSRMCIIESSLMFILLGIFFFIVLLIIGIAVITWYYKKRSRVNKRKNWISIPTSTPSDIISRINRVTAENANGNINMIVPDGRLYRETEFHVIVEKTEPLTTEL